MNFPSSRRNQGSVVGAAMQYGARALERASRWFRLIRMVPRSFVTNLGDNTNGAAGVPLTVRGIAFGGDTSVKSVAFSSDGGANWHNAALGKDYGRYSFRRWQTSFVPRQSGNYKVMANATNNNDLSQPGSSTWNPGCYMRNVIEQLTVHAA
jgi:hypothetical protein